MKRIGSGEREMGCTYCRSKEHLLEQDMPELVYGEECGRYDLQVIVDRGYLRMGDADDMQCMDHGEKIKINFCPMCGLKLEG